MLNASLEGIDSPSPRAIARLAYFLDSGIQNLNRLSLAIGAREEARGEREVEEKCREYPHFNKDNR